jgi:hypothetical protein
MNKEYAEKGKVHCPCHANDNLELCKGGDRLVRTCGGGGRGGGGGGGGEEEEEE